MDDAPNGMWPHGRPYVGQVAARSRTVTRDDIELFAQISGDRNPLHFDDEYAARTRFGGVVVQSGLITGILNWVCAEEIPGPGTVWIGPVFEGTALVLAVALAARQGTIRVRRPPDAPRAPSDTSDTGAPQDGAQAVEPVAVP